MQPSDCFSRDLHGQDDFCDEDDGDDDDDDDLADYGYLSKSKLMCFLSAELVDQHLILATPTNIY